MRAHDVAAVLGESRKEGRGWRCRCPLHGGRSLVVRDGDAGRLLATCWGGCDRLDLLAELQRLGLLDDSLFRPPFPPPIVVDHRDDARRIARASRIWDRAERADGTPVARYLAGRGITMAPPATLRWAPSCWHGAASRELPAMVGLVEHVERGIVGIQRTYLRGDGGGKADVPEDWQKRALGPIGGGAVRLGMPRPGEWFAVAEGIETTLSVMTAVAVPGWAALSEGGIRSLILPLEATHVVIAADRDFNGVGQRAAEEAAARWLTEGRRVRVAIPAQPGMDFNDLLCAGALGVRHVA